MSALSHNTHQIYNRAFHLFLDFCRAISILPFPSDAITLGLFIVHLHRRGYATNTIRTFVSAISYHNRIRQYPDPAGSFIITKAFQGLRKIRPPTEAREPISLELLHVMLSHLDRIATGYYEQSLFRAMLLCAFFALCRISEFTMGKTGHNLHRSDLTFRKTSQFQLSFRTFKHSVAKSSVTVNSQPIHCPVKALELYCASRPRKATFLFCQQNGQPIPRLQFVTMLQRLVIAANKDPQFFTSHSLRIGGATYAAQLGMSALQIQRLGRWRSTAFLQYLRW